MRTVTATDLRTKADETLEAAQKEPVAIEKNGRRVAVIVPHADYERLIRLENDYWLARAEAAERSGYLGAEATAAFLKEKGRGNC